MPAASDLATLTDAASPSGLGAAPTGDGAVGEEGVESPQALMSQAVPTSERTTKLREFMSFTAT